MQGWTANLDLMWLMVVRGRHTRPRAVQEEIDMIVCYGCYLGRATAGWSKPRAASGPCRPAHFAAPATECQPEGVSPVGRTMLRDTGTLHPHREHTVAQSAAAAVTPSTPATWKTRLTGGGQRRGSTWHVASSVNVEERAPRTRGRRSLELSRVLVLQM